MTLRALLHRYLRRTQNSSFRPIIVRDLRRAEELHADLRRHFNVAEAIVRDIPTLFAAAHTNHVADVVVVALPGRLESKDLNACNLGRSDIAGAGYPVVWVMTQEQREQLRTCPDLWSCRDMELLDDDLETCPGDL